MDELTTSSNRNILVVPNWLRAQIKGIKADGYCPDDTAYLVDTDGHVHPLKILGRLIDAPPSVEALDDDPKA